MTGSTAQEKRFDKGSISRTTDSSTKVRAGTGRMQWFVYAWRVKGADCSASVHTRCASSGLGIENLAHGLLGRIAVAPQLFTQDVCIGLLPLLGQAFDQTGRLRDRPEADQ